MLTFLCSVSLIAGLIPSCPQGPGGAIAGYVEGEYVALAPIEVARVVHVPATRGERFGKGDVVALLDRRDVELAVGEATAKRDQAAAELADLRSGRRAEEIAVIAANLNSAEALFRDAERALKRRQELFARGNTSQSDLDEARTNRDVAEARVSETRANLDVARLPARPDTIRAAEERLSQAESAIETAKWRLDRRTLVTPAPGRIADVVRRPGEVAGPTAPVISFLPDGATKLKVFVPEAVLTQAQRGRRLRVTCDGCGDATFATVTYVSPDPEFTPPVIYSVEARQKLVYLVEARPDGATTALQPGQIVDVTFESVTNDSVNGGGS